MKLVDIEAVVNVICQDCGGWNYSECPYDCDFIQEIFKLGVDIVRCKDCDCFENNLCKYYGKEKSENGFCNVGYKKI